MAKARQAPADRQEGFSEDDIANFLQGAYLTVDSSNVQGASYDPEEGELIIDYLSGPNWAYKVPAFKAETFIRAQSKGTWLWDNVKVRGSVHAHQVPARPIR